jgi:hypothetical protein
MISEDANNLSWHLFLIQINLTIKEEQEFALGVQEKTGTKAFMAIGMLLGEQHSFMHDLG